MPEIVETLKFKVKVLSPLHIGCGEDLDPMGYVVSKGTLYVITLDRLLESVKKDSVAAINAAARDRQLGRLRAAIKNAFENREDDSCIVRQATVSESFHDIYEKEIGKDIVNNALGFKQHISTMGKPYIPGSSLKGTIRTGILELAFNSNFNIDDEKRKQLDNERDVRIIEAELMGYAVTFGNRRKPDIKLDPFKLMKPRDSFLPEKSTEVCMVYNKNKTGKEKGIPIIMEVVREGVEFEVEIVLAAYGEAGKKAVFSRARFLKALDFCSEKTKEKAVFEKNRILAYSGLNDSQKKTAAACYDKVSNAEGTVLRLGYGSGYDFTAVKGFRFMKEPVKGKPGMGWGYSKNLTETGMPLGFISLLEG